MGWLSYTNRAKKDKKGKRQNWINSRWVWFIGEGNKNVSLQIVSRPSFGWGLSTEGCEQEVVIRFWFILTFYINFERVFPKWVYAKEYNQYSDEDIKSLKENSDNWEEKSYKIIKQNKKLKGKSRTKAKGWIRTATRELSLSFHNNSMWWEIWNDSDTWSSDIPKWRHGSFDLQRFIKGKDKVVSTVIKEQFGEIEMPEGKYLCKIKQSHSKKTYQRWFSKEWNRFNFEFGYNNDEGEWVITPIPHWGKGENSWDCGMDGTYSISLSCEVKNIKEANKRIIDSCMKDRKRYGNVDFSKVSGIEDGIVRKNLIGEF